MKKKILNSITWDDVGSSSGLCVPGLFPFHSDKNTKVLTNNTDMKMTILTLISCFVFASLTAPPAPSAVIFAAEGVNPFLKVWNASGIVESGKNPLAYHPTDQKGGSWGYVQIGQSMLNAYNKENGTHYVLQDCFDIEVSRKIFMWHFQKYYPSLEAGCRSWNGGNNWKHKKSTIIYWKKIQKAL